MADASTLTGVFTALLTPFSEDASNVNFAVLKNFIDRQVDAGIHGLVVAGSVGEFTSLTAEEWRNIVDVAIQHVNGRVPVAVGASAFTTAETVRRCKYAEEAGADGLLILPLGFWQLVAPEVKRHFATISDAVSLPIMVYNNPAKTAGTDLSAQLIRELSEYANVRYVKETSYDIHRVQEIIAACGDRITVFQGDDGAALPAFCLGARGWVAGMSNYAPALCAEVFDAFEARQSERAKSAHYRIVTMRAILEKCGPYVGVIRASTQAIGIPVGPSRPPLLPLESREREVVLRVMRDFSVIG